MFKNIISNIDNIMWFPIAVLIIFFIVFSVIIYRTMRMNKEEIKEASNIPLENNLINSKGDSNGRN